MGLKELKIRSDHKGSRQYAAVPVRPGSDGTPEILLLTSRGTGRWIIPKGWPMQRLSPGQTAAQEAYEEAGLQGTIVSETPIGYYDYTKGQANGTTAIITVSVFVLQVTQQLASWPEKAERETRWFSPKDAARLVAEPQLAAILRSFDAMTTIALDVASGAILPAVK